MHISHVSSILREKCIFLDWRSAGNRNANLSINNNLLIAVLSRKIVPTYYKIIVITFGYSVCITYLVPVKTDVATFDNNGQQFMSCSSSWSDQMKGCGNCGRWLDTSCMDCTYAGVEEANTYCCHIVYSWKRPDKNDTVWEKSAQFSFR